MAEKTLVNQETNKDVNKFINSVENSVRRDDAKKLLKIVSDITQKEPKV